MTLDLLSQLLSEISDAEMPFLTYSGKDKVYEIKDFEIYPETGTVYIKYISDVENQTEHCSASPYATFIYHLGVALESSRINPVLMFLNSWRISEEPVKQLLNLSEISWVCSLHDTLVYFHGRGTVSSFDISDLEYFNSGSKISYRLYQYILISLYKIIYTEHKCSDALYRDSGVYNKSLLTCVKALLAKTDIASLDVELPAIYLPTWTPSKFKGYFIAGFCFTFLSLITIIATVFNSDLGLLCWIFSALALFILFSGTFMYEKKVKSLRAYRYALDNWITNNFIEAEGSEALFALKGDNYA